MGVNRTVCSPHKMKESGKPPVSLDSFVFCLIILYPISENFVRASGITICPKPLILRKYFSAISPRQAYPHSRPATHCAE